MAEPQHHGGGDMDEDEVLESKNKNAIVVVPGNGLSGAGGPHGHGDVNVNDDGDGGGGKASGLPPEELETDPLQHYPPIKRFDEEEDDESEDTPSPTPRQGRDVFSRTARKLRMTPKKAVIYVGVSWLIIFVLLFILILLLSFWPRGSGREMCKSAECHAISAKMLGAMNITQEPCEDFWKFSCAGWFQKNPIPNSRGDWSTSLVWQHSIKQKVQNLINIQEFVQEPNSVDTKLTRYYEACMATHYIDRDGDKSLRRIINELGGWDALKNFRLNDFDFPRLLRKVHSEYQATPYFKIEVVRDPFSPKKNIIKISPAGLTLPDKYYYTDPEGETHVGLRQEAVDCSWRCKEILQKFHSERQSAEKYFNVYARDVIQMLGATNQDANTHAKRIFKYEARIASVMPDTNNSTMRENFTKIRVHDLNSRSNTIFWDGLLRALFPGGRTITDDTEVLVSSLDYLTNISAVISTSDSIVLNDYVMWHLVHKYLPYLSKTFLQAQETLRMDLTGSKKRKPRWEFCTDETIKVFLPVINAMLARNCDKRGQKLSKVDDMFDEIKKSLANRIQESTRFDESLRAWAVDKLRLMTIQIGATVDDKKMLIDLYHPFGVQSNEFFQNAVAANNFLLQLEQRDLSLSDNKATMVKNLFDIIFDPTSNRVVFPESRLQNDDLLVNEGQKAILYGSLGVEFAEVIARAFGPKDGLYLADGTMMTERDHKHQEIITLVEQKRTCLASFFTKIHLDDEPYIQRTSLDTTLHLAGIEIAFGAMGNSIATELPSLPYGGNEIFFLAYGQSQCSSNTLAFHDMEHASFTTLVHEHRVRGVLRQLGAFTDSYKCAKTTEMYADFRCGFVL